METGANQFRKYDSRSGLGYGQLKNRFHSPRKLADEFPYKAPVEPIDFEDEETESVIHNKLQKTPQGGIGDRKSADPFYYVAGNTKLSDCFFRTGEIISSVYLLEQIMTNNYLFQEKLTSGGGAATYLTVGSARRTGSNAGYSSAPPRVDIEDIDEEEENFYGLYDLSRILRKDRGE